jgi:hypothetical protein
MWEANEEINYYSLGGDVHNVSRSNMLITYKHYENSNQQDKQFHEDLFYVHRRKALFQSHITRIEVHLIASKRRPMKSNVY